MLNFFARKKTEKARSGIFSFSIFNYQLSIFNYQLSIFNFQLFIICCLFATTSAIAQRDTSKRQTIDITSSYKPVLRNSVKINFSATPMLADTSKRRLSYDIPALNLFFSYQPVTLKPLALSPDKALMLGGRNYVKAGFGNFTTPYLDAAASFGDGKKALGNLYANYISSKGNIEHQDFSEFKVKGEGSYFSSKNEAYGGAAFSQKVYYQYGYDHSLHDFTKEDIRRKYQDLALTGGFRNIAENDIKINYNPSAEIHIFSRENKATENSLIIDLPAEKRFSENVAFKISGKIDIDNLTNKKGSVDTKINNNLFQIAPEFVYYSDVFTFHGGATPSWDNNELHVLPNLYAEAQLQHNILMIQAGWVGRYIKNNFRTLSNMNPYMQDPTFLLNTKEIEFYGGIKATVGMHFSFNAKASFITYNNMPLFINDTTDGKSFYISNERKMNNLQLHGDMNYVSQDKFTLTGALDINTYTGLKDNANAWHLIPLQLTGSLRWNAFKQVLLKGDLFAFSGIPVLLKNNVESKLKAGTDLSAGAEFKINEKFSAWLDFNNLLNRKYQRWNNYHVYGLNIIGGVVLHF